MTSLLLSDLPMRLANASDAGRLGPVLADALLEMLGADLALIWLPREDPAAFDAADLSVKSAVPDMTLPDAILHAARMDDVAAWLMAHGYAVVASELPAHRPGMLVVGWTAQAPLPASADVLTMTAAVVGLQAERRALEERLGDAVAGRMEAAEQISRTRRVRILGEMASGIVHDFNNLLTSILGYTELAIGELQEGDPFYKDLHSIRTAALDGATLVRRLQSLGRKSYDGEVRELIDLRDVAQMMPALVRPRWMRRSHVDGLTFDIVVDAQPVPLVSVVVAEIRELLLNLLFNAVDAMPTGGQITIRTATDANGHAVISVQDQGVGMTEDIRRNVFEPFFTTKGDKGSGLGLSVCQTIANSYGAQLTVESAPNAGATFDLCMPPAVLEDEMRLTEPVAPTVGRQVPRRILLVDDQQEVRESVGDMLRAMGHEVQLAESGEAAVAAVSRHPLDVVITDLGMPGMNGINVAQHVGTLAPKMPVVLLTGWGLEPEATRPPNVAFVLGKPVTLKQLSDALTACAAA